MILTSPQPFVIREECEKAAWEHGYRRVLGETDGWAAFESTTAQGTLWLAAASDQGPWYLALDHPGVSKELQVAPTDAAGPGLARFSFPNLTALYAVLPRLYQPAARKDRFELGPEAVVEKLIHALESPRPAARYPVTLPAQAAGIMRRLFSARLLDRVLRGR